MGKRGNGSDYESLRDARIKVGAGFSLDPYFTRNLGAQYCHAWPLCGLFPLQMGP